MSCLKLSYCSDKISTKVSELLGSGTWITYTDGEAIQHLHYLPDKKLRFFSSLAFGNEKQVFHYTHCLRRFGEEQIDQRLTSFNSRYTFSAKEKDIETGYSYFGARYYDSDLNIWLSVDPLSDKYPSLSPYAYCANNPIKLIDPNGRDITMSFSVNENGNKVIDINFTGVFMNKSERNISKKDMNKYKEAITQSLKDYYGGGKDDGTIVNVNTDIIVGDFWTAKGSRHEINLVENCSNSEHMGEAPIGGNFMNIDVDVLANFGGKQGNSNFSNTFERTVGHEFGHLLGLDHVNNENNLMNPSRDGTTITGSQMKEAYSNYPMNMNNGFRVGAPAIRKELYQQQSNFIRNRRL